MKKNYLVAFLCILTLMFNGCATTGEEKIDVNSKTQYCEELDNLRREHEILQEEYQDLQKLAAEAVNIILEEEPDQSQLVRLAQTQWEYDINFYEIDEKGPLSYKGQQLNTLTKIETGSNFAVVVGERWAYLDILPDEIIEMGSIGAKTGNFIDHIQIVSPVAYESFGTAGGTVIGNRYHFLDVPIGVEIKLLLTPELQSRLDHPTGTITITVD